MATFQPPIFRDIGGATSVEWSGGAYVASATPVTVHGDPNATYVSAGAGAEGFDLDVDGLGVVSIVSIGTEASAADWVATINAAYFAAFGVNPAFVDVAGTLAIEAVNRIVVSNYLDTGAPPGDAAFGVIGLPVIDRRVLPTTAFQPDREPTLQGVSSPIDVPRGANVVTVNLIAEGVGAEPASIVWGLCLNDPTDPDPVGGVQNIIGLPFVDGAFAPVVGRFAMRQAVMDLLRTPEVPLDWAVKGPRMYYEFRLPNTFDGVSTPQIRLWVAVSIAGASAPLPQENPTVIASVKFSAR